MEEKKYCLRSSATLSVAKDDIDRLLDLGDGLCALLYLHILRHDGSLICAAASRDLNRSEEEILSAAKRLQEENLLTEDIGRVLPAENLPAYKPADILRKGQEDSSFRALVTEAQRILGRTLSGADLQTLLGIYEQLGLQADTVMLLINHCADWLKQRYGEGRLPTMRFIEKEAFRWVDRGILTAEKAEEYLAQAERMNAEQEKLLRTLQIFGRKPTTAEQKYIDSWLSMGYNSEALGIAYERTVLNTNRLAWSYMNKIVLSWYEKGLFSAEDILAKDSLKKTASSRNSLKKDTGCGTGEDDTAKLAEKYGLR